MTNDDDMRSEISVYFEFAGFDIDPDEITRLTGITPTRIRRAGDPIYGASLLSEEARQRIRVKVNRWDVNSGLDPNVDLPTQVKALFERLEPAWDRFIELSQQYVPVMECIVKSYGGDRPQIFFDKEVIRKLAELNAEIGVDLYVSGLPLSRLKIK